MRLGGPSRANGRISLVFLAVLVATAALAAGSGAAAPTNDSFAAAQAISGSSGSTAGSNVGATQETSEPLQGRSGGHTVWFAWTAPSSGSTTLDTMGSALDTVVSVYTGTRVDRLTLIATDDDGAG